MAIENEGAGHAGDEAPTSVEAFETLEAQHFDAKDWRGLIGLYEVSEALSAEMTSYWDRLQGFLELLADEAEAPEERSKVHLAMGRIYEDRQQRYDLSIKAYQESFRADRTQHEPLLRAREVYKSRGRYDMVIKLFKTQLDVTEGAEAQAAVLREIGRTLLIDLNDPPAAKARLSLALTLNPDDEDAQRLMAVALGEALPEPEPAEEGLEVTTRMRAMTSAAEVPALESPPGADTLPEYHVDTDEHDPPEDVLRMATGSVSAVVEEAEDDDRDDMPTAELEAVPSELAEAVEAAEAEAEAERQREETGEHAETEELDEPEAEEPEAVEPTEAEAEEPEAVEPARGDEGAEAAWRAVRDADPRNLDAIVGLRRIWEERRDWDSLVELYTGLKRQRRRKTELGFDPTLELADLLWRKVGDHAAAEAHFKRLRLSDPKNPRMLAFYADHYRRSEDWKRLLATLQSLRNQAETTEARLALAHELAEVAEDKLEQPERAIDVWKQIHAEQPSTESATALRRLYAQAQKYNGLLEFLKGEVKRCAEGELERQVELLFEIADIYGDHLKFPTSEAHTLAEILEIDPGNQRAAEALMTRYEATQNWGELVNMLGRQAEADADPSAEAALRRRIAAIWRDELGNVSHAVPELERVAELEPENRLVLGELRSIYASRNETQPLLGVLERESVLVDGDERIELLREMASLARDRLGDDGETVRIAKRLLEQSDGRDALALTILEEIYRGREAWDALVPILEARRASADSRSEEVAVLLSLGDLYESQIGAPEKALTTYAEALEVEPEATRAVERIIALHLEARRWDDLETLCRDRGDLGRYCDLLEAAAESADASGEIGLQHRVARVAAEDLHEPERVMRALEAILTRSPEDLSIAEALIPYYEGAGAHHKLVGVLELLSMQREGAAGAALTRRLAEVWEADLGDSSQAFEWAGQTLERAPDQESSRRELERLGRELGRLEEVVDRLERAAGERDGAARLALLKQAARLAWEELGVAARPRATDLLEAVLREDATDREAIDALETVHSEAQDDEALLRVLRHRLSVLDDPAEVIELQLRIAGVQGERLGDLTGAIATYTAVLEADPSNGRALQALKQAHTAREEWAAVVDLTRRQLEEETGDRSRLLFELGQVEQHKQGEIEAAVDAYAELVEQSPDSELRPRTIETLWELLDAGHLPGPIAAVLEPVYRQAEDWSSLAHVLAIRVEHGEEPEGVRLEWMRELARLHECELGDQNGAFEWLRRAAAAQPTRESWFDDLERLAANTGEWGAVADFHREAMEESPENLVVARRLARVLETRLGSLSEAVEAWQRIYVDNPRDEEAVGALDRLYLQTGDVDALVQLLETRADNAESDEDRKAALFRICDVLQNEGRAMEAQPYYQRVFDLDETDPRAFEALRVLFDAAEDWDRLSALLELRLGVCDPAEMADLRMQLGSLREGVLDDPEGAAEAYREVIVDDLSHAGAADALRRLFKERIGDDLLIDLRDQIYHTLRTTYEMREDWESSLALEQLQLEDSAKQDMWADHHQQMAELLRDRLGRPREAFEHFAGALRADYENSEVRAEVERLADSLELWPELVALYTAGVEGAGDEYLRVELHRRLAQLTDRKTGDPRQAIAHYEAVRANEPEDREALNALERLYDAGGELEPLVEIRQQKADLTSGSERLGLLRKNAATLRDGLGDLESAVDANHLILAERPGDRTALDTLEELNEKLGRWDALVQVILDKVDLSTAAEERRLLYQQVATIREDQLDDVDGAIDAYLAMLDIDPADATALVALERLYESTERWADLAGILRRRLDLFDDVGYRGGIALRLAGVLETKLSDRAGAIALYREVLEGEPGNMHAVVSLESLLADEDHRLAAVEVLLPVYERSEMWRDVVRLLELRVDATPDLGVRLDTLLRIREVNESRIGDITGAFSAACRAYEASPMGNLREQAERLAQHTGDFEALAGAYENAQEAAETDDNALLIHMRLADLYLSQLGRAEAAEGHFREALEIAPDNLDALESLEALFDQGQRPRDLLEILERRVELARDADDVKSALMFLYRVAELQEVELASPEEAVAAWRRCLDLSAGDGRAFSGLNRLFRGMEDWAGLVDLLTEQLTHAESEAGVAELRHEQALVLAGPLEEPAAALETWADVLSLAPAHAGAIEALEGVVRSLGTASPDLAARAAELLEPHYRGTKAWGPLAGALERRAAVAEAPEAADLLTEAAKIREQRLGDGEAAFDRLARVFELVPRRQIIWTELDRLAADLDCWRRLADLFQEGIERSEDLTDRELPELGLLLGTILDHSLDDQDGARRAFELVIEVEPGNEAALEALERLYSQIPDWEELVALYRHRADLVSAPPEQLPYLLKIGRLQEELSDSEAAVEAYRSVLDIDSLNAEALGSLERIFGFEERYEDLAELLERRAAQLATDVEQAEALFRLGRVLEVDLGSVERAVPVYRRVLAMVPDHGPTRRALESLLEQLRQEQGDPTVRMTIVETLEGVYDPTTEWTELIELVEARLEIVDDVPSRAQALQRAAELAEESGNDPRTAFELHARAFREDPGHRSIREHLERLVVETRSWAELAEAYVDGLTKLQEPEAAVSLMLRTAEIFEKQLHEPEGAVRVLEELLDVDSQNLEALNQLDRLYRELGRYEQLVVVLSRKVETTDDVLDQKEFLYQVADIQETRLKSVDDAAETFRRILDLDPEDIVALGSLERLLRKAERWAALVDILMSKTEVVDDEVERRNVYLDMAEVYEQSLDDRAAAIGVYRTLLANEPADEVAIAALDRLYVETESWGELLDIIEGQRGLASEVDAINALDLRSAGLLSEALLDVPRAIEVYRTVLERTPRQPDALEALIGLLDGDYGESAMAVLEPLHRAWGDWERVVWLLERRVEAEPDASKRHVVLQEVAEIAESRLLRPDAAFYALSRALQEDPEDADTLDALARLADAEDYWEALAETLDVVSAEAENPETQRVLRLRAANIYESELSQPGLAVERYRDVLETHPVEPDALKALDRLYFNDRDWEALADILTREIDIVTDEGDMLDLRFRLGYIREMVFQDPTGAMALYADALELKSDFDKGLESLTRLQLLPEQSRAATEILAAAYEKTRAWPELANVYSVALDHETESVRRAELLRLAAALTEDELGRPEEAFALFAGSFQEMPDSREVMVRLEHLAESLDSWGDLAVLYDDVRDRVEDRDLRLAVLGKLAAWYDQRLQRPDLAEARYREVLAVDPEDDATRDRLETLYEREANHAALFDLLAQRADRASDDGDRRELLGRMAKLAEETLSDPRRTAEVYERLRLLDPNDLEVVLELVRLHAQLGDMARLVDALGYQAELESDDEKKAALFQQVGQLCQTQLGDHRRAADALARSVSLAPELDDRYETLEALYRDLEDWDALVELLASWVDRAEGAPALAVTARLATVLEERFSDLAGAIARYEEAVAAGPVERWALNELARLQAKDERWSDLDATYGKLEASLREASDAGRPELLQLLQSRASLRSQQLEDPDGAVEVLRTLLEVDPDHVQALDTLGNLLESSESWADALDVVARQIDLTEDRRALGDLYHRQGRLLQATDASAADVIGAWERALENDDRRLDVARGLLGLYREAKRPLDVWTMLSALIAAEEDLEERRSLAVEAARVARDDLDDAERLVQALELALELDPEDLEVVDELAGAYLRVGAHERAAPLIDQLVEARSKRATKRDMARLHHLRGLVAQGMGDEVSAEEGFVAAYSSDAGFLPNLMSLAKLRYNQGQNEESLRLFQTMLLQQMRLKSPAERVDIFYHMGQLMLAKGDRRRARDMFMRALSIDRDHEPSKVGLAELE